jgi:hypothetical protein
MRERKEENGKKREKNEKIKRYGRELEKNGLDMGDETERGF